MSDFKDNLHELFVREGDELVRRITSSYLPREEHSWSRGEVEQFVRASLATYQEGLDGGRESRDYFLSAVLPGVVRRGTTLEQMVTEGYRCHLLLHALCADLLPQETRRDALEWLVEFAVSWMSEVFHRTRELEADVRKLA